MFVPLYDMNSLKHIRHQYITYGLIAVNIVLWFATGTGSGESLQAAVLALGYIPAIANSNAALPPELALVPPVATYFTYAFLHADIFHLSGNMLFLWVFGDNVEDAFGHFRFLLFYLACAAAGALLHGLILPFSEEPLIGASGGIAGVVAAYLILHPRIRLWVLAFGKIPLRIPAVIPLLGWVGYQFAMLAGNGEDRISWAAHVGGIVSGVVLVMLFRRRGVPLFDRPLVTPDAVEVQRDPPATLPESASRPPWGRH